MDQENTAPRDKTGGNFQRGIIKALIPISVFLVPLILYLLYIEKQEDYFKIFYHRQLSNIVRKMDGRLDFLRQPMSLWLSGMPEDDFRANAPKWLQNFKSSDCASATELGKGMFGLIVGTVKAKLSQSDSGVFKVSAGAQSEEHIRVTIEKRIVQEIATETAQNIALVKFDILKTRQKKHKVNEIIEKIKTKYENNGQLEKVHLLELFEKHLANKKDFKNIVDCPKCPSDKQTYDALQQTIHNILSLLPTQLESQSNKGLDFAYQEDKSGKKTANGKKVGATEGDKAQTTHDDCKAIIPIKDCNCSHPYAATGKAGTGKPARPAAMTVSK